MNDNPGRCSLNCLRSRVSGGALYLALVIALIIGIMCASFLTLAFYFRTEQHRYSKNIQLFSNLNSSIDVILKSNLPDIANKYALFEEGEDSLIVEKGFWGLYEYGLSSVYIGKDTLKRGFLIGRSIENDNIGLFLTDEDRPLVVNGNTYISGDVYLPKSGVRSAFVDGKPYLNEKLVYGKTHESQRELKALNEERIADIEALFTINPARMPTADKENIVSFFKPQVDIHINGSLSGKSFTGKMVIHSEGMIRIPSSANLQDVIVVAPAIVVESGFKGVAQLYARDSIVVQKNVILNYPSAAGVLKSDTALSQAYIKIGENTTFSGIAFVTEKTRTLTGTMLKMDKNATLKGEIYVSGTLMLSKGVVIYGKASCINLSTQTDAHVYPNYLIDVKIDPLERSRFYLTSSIFAGVLNKKEILKWLK